MRPELLGAVCMAAALLVVNWLYPASKLAGF
jgi:hypothetical protein